MYDNTNPTSNTPDFYGSDVSGFPKQPYSTFTNFAFFIPAALCFSIIKERNKYSLYFPYYVVGFWSWGQGIGSGLMHSTNGYGKTGSLDVGIIAAYIISIFWLLVWTTIVYIKWNHKFNPILPCFIDRTEQYIYVPFETLWFVPNVFLILVEITIFILRFFEIIDISWKLQLDIFIYGIATLLGIYIVFVIYSLTRRYYNARYFSNYWVTQFMVSLMLIIVSIGLLFISKDDIRIKHGTTHIIQSLLISSVIIYTDIIYIEVLGSNNEV